MAADLGRVAFAPPKLGTCCCLLWVLASHAFCACTTDHDQLAKRPAPANEAVTATAAGGSSATLDSTQGAAVTTGSGGGFQYPSDGDDVLTLVHGQVDAQKLAFCFAESVDGELVVQSGPPLPEAGLDYGAHVSVAEPGGLRFAESDIVPIALAGAGAEAFDFDCSEASERADWLGASAVLEGSGGASGAGGAAAAGPPRPRAMELPLLPRGTLVLGKNYALVISGCMGGAAIKVDASDCGAGFDPASPTLNPLLFPVSRERVPGKLSLQFLHASRSSPEVDLRSQPASAGGMGAMLATRLSYGFAWFAGAEQTWSMAALGIDQGASIEVLRSSQPALDVPWQTAAELGGALPLSDGEPYLMILIGPNLLAKPSAAANPPQVTLIPTGVAGQE